MKTIKTLKGMLGGGGGGFKKTLKIFNFLQIIVLIFKKCKFLLPTNQINKC